MPYRATSHWERHPRPRLRAFLLSGDILSQQTDETSKSPLRLAPSNYPKQESSLLLTMCRRISLVPQASSISPAAKPLFLTAQYSLPAFSRPDGIWRINSTLKGSDAQSLCSAWPPIAGRMDGTFDLEGTFYPLEGTITVAEAKGKVHLTEGTLLGIDLEKARQILINEAPETLPPELVAKTARTRLSELTADIALTKTSESEHFIKISGKALAPRVGSAELPWIAEFAGEASHSR